MVARRAGVSLEEHLRRVAAGEKFCWRCQAYHPVSAFNVDRSRSDGLDPACRVSRNKRAVELYEPTPRVSKLGQFFVETRDSDPQQARCRTNHNVKTGLLPAPNTLPCVDCGHIWKPGERRHEYHHHNGYGAAHQLDVISLCTRCHNHRDNPKAKQTHCVNGHEFTPENTKIRANGSRVCRECVRVRDRGRRDAAYWRAWRAARRAQVSKNSGVTWTDDSFNTHWGCTEVSPECDMCYAREFDARFFGGPGQEPSHWGKDAPRRFFGEKHWNEPLAWNRAAANAENMHHVMATRGLASGPYTKPAGHPTRRLVFVDSMSDLFEGRDDLEPWRLKLWGLIKLTPALTWLLLTKRPQNIRRMAPDEIIEAPNVWFGTTVGLPASLWRADTLNHDLPATATTFVSMEPLLEETAIGHKLARGGRGPGVKWAITGSESGSGSRPMDTNWARRIICECQDAGVPVFLKQAEYGAEGISARPPGAPSEAEDPKWADTSRDRAYIKRDMRKGADGMTRLHKIVERPYLDGIQHVAWPA